jgi:hypothetical protein
MMEVRGARTLYMGVVIMHGGHRQDADLAWEQENHNQKGYLDLLLRAFELMSRASPAMMALDPTALFNAVCTTLKSDRRVALAEFWKQFCNYSINPSKGFTALCADFELWVDRIQLQIDGLGSLLTRNDGENMAGILQKCMEAHRNHPEIAIVLEAWKKVSLEDTDGTRVANYRFLVEQGAKAIRVGNAVGGNSLRSRPPRANHGRGGEGRRQVATPTFGVEVAVNGASAVGNQRVRRQPLGRGGGGKPGKKAVFGPPRPPSNPGASQGKKRCGICGLETARHGSTCLRCSNCG